MPQEVRFIRRGVAKYISVPTIANLASPTRSELTAGLDFTGRIADIAGWQVQGADADVPDMSSAFDKKTPGTYSLADSSFDIWTPKTGTDAVRVALPRLTVTNIVIMGAGDVPTTGKMNVFPVIVRTLGDAYSMGNDAARYQLQFSPTDEPRIDITIPT